MYNANQEEQKILELWDKTKAFEKSVSERPESKPYVFYDGPPFATGLPHYGHIVASTMKDVVPRYWTMRGYRVERKWGWDCHGLPIENIIEKDLHLQTRQDILAYGVGKFNEACRATVLRYAEDWKKTIRRMGRWVDMENDYKTMDVPYMESVWWVFKSLWDAGFMYKGHKAMHICPRCVTPLSNFEVTQGYKEVKDISVTAKFKLKATGAKYKKLFSHITEPVSILAWTTTPWTLPGNVLLALGHDVEYVLVKESESNEWYIVARERAQEVFKDKTYVEEGRFKGSELTGLDYEPLFPYFANTANAFRTVTGDFVTTADGTGIVHIAPAFGEDDYAVGQREDVPLVQHVTMEGKFIEKVVDFAGQNVKPKDDLTKTDVEIIKWLAHNGKLFSKQKFEHSYPHCWRCDTPLLNYATSSWFVKVTEIKKQLLKNNETINWVPEHIKEGRFGKWLEGARDWAISRNRYWGTPLPVWECVGKKQITNNKEQNCDNVAVIGSVAELEKLSGKEVADLHKHIVDEVVFPCSECGGEMRRIPEVLDCWFESGSMPYGQMHYPFENREKFEAAFPAEFIAEGQDQTRGWFYTLHILATALTYGKDPAIKSTKKSVPAFKNVIVNGIVLAEDGKKMSKRLKNYPEPDIVLEKYGADAMRYYLVSSPVMEAESFNFSEAGVREMFNKVVNTLSNVLEFYVMFADQKTTKPLEQDGKGGHVLDNWIMSKLHALVKEVTEKMEAYRLAEASRPIVDFITELSTWYVRRSRDRFKGDNEEDKQNALHTLHEVLLTLSKVMAPFTPFIAEKMYQEITGGKAKESVHLEEWPKYHEEHHQQGLLDEMSAARKFVELGLAIRAEQKIKVRQPLKELLVNNEHLSHELQTIIADELNVKHVAYIEYVEDAASYATKTDGKITAWLCTTVDAELKAEGLLREVIRTINQMRKEQKLTINDEVSLEYTTDDTDLRAVFEKYGDEIKRSVLAKTLKSGAGEGQEVLIEEKPIKLRLNR